jgi:hypothetical protein
MILTTEVRILEEAQFFSSSQIRDSYHKFSQMGKGNSFPDVNGWSVKLTIHFHLIPSSRTHGKLN